MRANYEFTYTAISGLIIRKVEVVEGNCQNELYAFASIRVAELAEELEKETGVFLIGSEFKMLPKK